MKQQKRRAEADSWGETGSMNRSFPFPKAGLAMPMAGTPARRPDCDFKMRVNEVKS